MNVCDVCLMTFTDVRTLNKHTDIHTGIKRFSCDICNRAFALSNDMSRHKSLMLAGLAAKCVYRHLQMSAHLTHTNPLISASCLSCNVCNVAFSCGDNLIWRMLIHSEFTEQYVVRANTMQSTCDNCNTELSHLTGHKCIHSGQKSYMCDVCLLTFTSSLSVYSVGAYSHIYDVSFLCTDYTRVTITVTLALLHVVACVPFSTLCIRFIAYPHKV